MTSIYRTTRCTSTYAVCVRVLILFLYGVYIMGIGIVLPIHTLHSENRSCVRIITVVVDGKEV